MSRDHRSVVPLVLLAGVMLGACTGAGSLRTSAETGYDANLEGSQLAVERPLEVPAGQARLFFQDGVAVLPGSRKFGRYDLYQPHCAVEIDSVDHSGFVIEPGRFLVTRVDRVQVSVVWLDRPHFAGLSMRWGSDFGRSDRLHDGYHFWLYSDQQAAVRRLSCFGVFARPSELSPPTLQEINHALGDAATLGGPAAADP